MYNENRMGRLRNDGRELIQSRYAKKPSKTHPKPVGWEPRVLNMERDEIGEAVARIGRAVDQAIRYWLRGHEDRTMEAFTVNQPGSRRLQAAEEWRRGAR